jgi:dienelactone hydrolase
VRRRFGSTVAAMLVAVLTAGAGAWLLAGVSPADRRHVVVDGVPLDEVHPVGARDAARRPGVVVAHGFAGSARLMTPFADTLSAQGYVVVLLDFTGHGASTRRLPAGPEGSAADSVRQRDLDVALAHLRALPDVDPSRIALVGHSMGAGAVTRYAADHPGITATAAISLPDAADLPRDRPARLLLLVGGLEFAGFRTAAGQAVQEGGRGRSAVVVPGVEHISILYAPRTHREVARWLNDSFGFGAPAALPSPVRRPGAAALLFLAFLVGMYPMARLTLGERPSRRPRFGPARTGHLMAVTAVASGPALLVAPWAPTIRLPLAVAGFVVGFVTVTGVGLLAYRYWRSGEFRATTAAATTAVVPAAATPGGTGPGRLRRGVATPVLLGYAALTIAVPLHLGFTHALPVGIRWWLLAAVWAGFCVLAYAAERLSDGNGLDVLAVSMIVVLALTGAAIAGLTSGFLLLVVPLLAVLMLWQAIWSAVLNRFEAPPWLVAPVGALLVAWPIAVTLPMIS